MAATLIVSALILTLDEHKVLCVYLIEIRGNGSSNEVMVFSLDQEKKKKYFVVFCFYIINLLLFILFLLLALEMNWLYPFFKLDANDVR